MQLEITDELVEKVAKAISPYGWNNQFWQDARHADQYDRNQRHVQENARAAARSALIAVRREMQ